MSPREAAVLSVYAEHGAELIERYDALADREMSNAAQCGLNDQPLFAKHVGRAEIYREIANTIRNAASTLTAQYNGGSRWT
mgnify:FL=1